MTKEQIKAVLELVQTWPEEDQEELAELAREIEARRKGVYIMTDDEQEAVRRGRLSDLASEEDVASFWGSHGLA
jgi:hypothetical protein